MVLFVCFYVVGYFCMVLGMQRIRCKGWKNIQLVVCVQGVSYESKRVEIVKKRFCKKEMNVVNQMGEGISRYVNRF